MTLIEAINKGIKRVRRPIWYSDQYWDISCAKTQRAFWYVDMNRPRWNKWMPEIKVSDAIADDYEEVK